MFCDEVPFEFMQPDPDLPEIPPALDHFQFGMCTDAAHANEYFQSRSTTGYAGTLAGAAVVYRCKTQPITAQNTTESETVSANAAAKVAKYFRLVLKELGYPQPGPTPIYKDNDSTIKLVKHDCPTGQSHHINIRYFRLQQWQRLGDIVLKFLPGKVNPADCLTKALGWILFLRHAPYLMGHFGFKPSSPKPSSSS